MSFTAIESERATLSCLMTYPAQTWPFLTSARLRIDHFTLPAHKEIYRCLSEMLIGGSDANATSVMTKLEGQGKIPKPVTVPMLSEIATLGAIPASLPDAIKNLKSKFMLRKMSRLLSMQTAALESPEADVMSVIDQSMTEMLDIAAEREVTQARTTKEIVMTTVANVVRRGSGEISELGVKTGMSQFDKETGGMRPSAYWVVAGQAKGGKTAFALNLLVALAIHAQKRTAFFGLETPAEENVERMLCRLANVKSEIVRDGELQQDDVANLSIAAEKIIASPIIFRDSCYDLSHILAEIKQIKMVHGDLYAVFVDYTQLVENAPGYSRQEQVASVSRALRRVSMEEGLFVCVLSQLNDDGLMRESRSIQMDATCLAKIELGDNPASRNVSLIQRNGRSGVSIRMNYNGEYCRFTEAATDEKEETREHPNARKR